MPKDVSGQDKSEVFNYISRTETESKSSHRNDQMRRGLGNGI